MVVRYGYNDIVITEGLGDLVYEKLKQFITTTPSRSQSAAIAFGNQIENSQLKYVDGRTPGSSEDQRKAQRLQHLDEAYAAQTVYVSELTLLDVWSSNSSRSLAKSN